MADIQIQTTREIVERLTDFADRYPYQVRVAVIRVLQEILTESKKICPTKTGYLRGSGYVADPGVEDGRITAYIGYSAGYAWWVHELIENYHHPPTQAKFLETPLQMYGDNIPQAVVDEVNRILGV
jgi:hypothetical protein